MQENVSEGMNQVIILLTLAFLFLLMGKVFWKALSRRFAPVKQVKAQVIRKTRQEVFSKYSGSGKRCRYVVVFSAEGKNLSFYVSEISYGGYKVKERGTLTYRGDRLLDFH